MIGERYFNGRTLTDDDLSTMLRIISEVNGLNVAWSEENEAFMATSPEFPGLSAFGGTIDEALAEGKVALELMIDEYTGSGLPLPPLQQA
jgi:predicted RNase H-like HicB family nuclease